MVDIADSHVLVGDGADRTSAAKYFKDRWEDEIFIELRANLYFMNLVSEVPRDKITGGTYKQPKVGKMGIRNLVPGTPVTLQAYTEDEFSMVFKRYREASFMIFDVAELFDDFGLRAEWTREIASIHAFDVDHWIQGYRAVINKAGNVVNSVDSGGANSTLNRAAILAAKLTADKNFMPMKERVWVFAPDQLISLLAIPEFTSGDYVQGSPTMTGEIGSLYGYPVVINNNIVKNAADGITIITGESSGARTTTSYPTPGFYDSVTPSFGIYWPDSGDTSDSNGAGQETLATGDSLPSAAYTGMLVHKDWIKFGWAKPPSIETDRQVTYQGNVTVSAALYDAKVYRSDYAVIINSYETT